MKVGDYVRNSHFGIGRINRDYYDNDGKHWYNVVFKCYQDNNNHCGINENTCGFEISSKPIGLIQVGDYINGEEVLEVLLDGTMSRVKTELATYFNNDIKSVVTKEQFERMEYKVGDNNEWRTKRSI